MTHRDVMSSVGENRATGPWLSVVVGTFFVAMLWWTISAVAQVGPLQVIRPWAEEPHWSETFDEILFFERGHTKGADESIKTFYWDSLGRIKFFRDDSEPAFSLGYRVLTMDNDSENSFLNGQLNDVALTGGGEVGEIFHDWRLSLVAGLGTANDGHWSNDDAVYGLGTLDLWTPLSEESALHLGMYYDGNRALLQDFPLPMATYWHRLNDQLEITIGLPDTFIRYRPLEKLTLTFLYHFPVEVRTEVDFELAYGVHLFALYARSIRQFYEDDEDNRRLFYEIDRVAAGVRWVTKWFDAALGVGYALDHRYRFGWDMRDLDTVRDLSEEFYGSLTLRGTF